MSHKIYSGSLTTLIAAAALSCGPAQANSLFAFLSPAIAEPDRTANERARAGRSGREY